MHKIMFGPLIKHVCPLYYLISCSKFDEMWSSLIFTLIVVSFAGLFTINFKREFVRCCCCFRSNWSQKKLIMAFTRNYFWRTHHKSPYTRTSYSSVRTPYSSSFTKFNNNGRMGGGQNHACVRYQCNGPNCVNKVTLGYRINHVNLPTIQTKHHCADGNNDNLQACQGSDLNRSLKIRSVSDSGIALRNFTPSSQPTEEQEKSASV